MDLEFFNNSASNSSDVKNSRSFQMHTPAISRGSQNKIQVNQDTPLPAVFDWRCIQDRQSGKQISQPSIP